MSNSNMITRYLTQQNQLCPACSQPILPGQLLRLERTRVVHHDCEADTIDYP